MHYALKNQEGKWLHWDDGTVDAGNKIQWFAILPVNENKYKESGWLIKQDKLYLSLSDEGEVKAASFASVPAARALA